MYFDVTFGIFLSLKRLFVGETVGENFHLRNSTLTVTILALHGSLSKMEGELFLLQKSRGGFPHEHTHTVENPRSHQMTLDYFYGQSGELLSYHGTDESYRGRDRGIKAYLSNGMGTTM